MASDDKVRPHKLVSREEDSLGRTIAEVAVAADEGIAVVAIIFSFLRLVNKDVRRIVC